MSIANKTGSLWVLNSEVVAKYATRKLAYNAVRDAFIAAASGQADVFPVVIGTVAAPETRVSIKSGINHSNDLLGLKVGSYWPDNARYGLSNHGSTTLLYDINTGMPRALINARQLNGLRTAAANAVATDALARPESTTLAVFGTGHQAGYEVRAVCAVRDIKHLRIWSRTVENAKAFADSFADLTLDSITIDADADAVVREADIVTTATISRAPLFNAASVKPGTHISAMGADKLGKQELDPQLLIKAGLFADEPLQSQEIGEFQHGVAQGLIDTEQIIAVGAVLSSKHPGRISEQQVTVFDSSGIAIQDLNVAEVIVKQAVEEGTALSIAF